MHVQGYRVAAKIAQPSREILSAYDDGADPERARFTSRDILVVYLKRLAEVRQPWTFDPLKESCHLEASPANNYRINLPPIAFAVPPCIREQQNVKYVLEAKEIGAVRKFAHIVTGSTGEALRPYYIGDTPCFEQDWHTQAFFTHKALGRVSFSENDQGECTLGLDRAEVSLSRAGTAALLSSTVLLKDLAVDPELLEVPRLAVNLQGWYPALSALYDRLDCPGYRANCELSHYNNSDF